MLLVELSIVFGFMGRNKMIKSKNCQKNDRVRRDME